MWLTIQLIKRGCSGEFSAINCHLLDAIIGLYWKHEGNFVITHVFSTDPEESMLPATIASYCLYKRSKVTEHVMRCLRLSIILLVIPFSMGCVKSNATFQCCGFAPVDDLKTELVPPNIDTSMIGAMFCLEMHSSLLLSSGIPSLF